MSSQVAVERMAWSGVCDECLTGVTVYPTADQAPEVQQEVSDTWPRGLAECPTSDCDGTIDWNGSDPIADVLATKML
ncbi:hypothetical protein SEA_ZAGIE_55 [Microbacterium phage Zagie]|nr:hypothetical protein SEA_STRAWBERRYJAMM_58 [Microbacterium phage StrawberryJamm]UVG35408.1 hypothetical protein SEA_ZAGIE_55 [Microbacterium phage Zagie]